MDVLIIMCLGILAGRFLLSPRIKKMSETISVVCTFLLIFSMGVVLGNNENFFKDLSSLGFSSLLFFLIPTAFSILIVFILTRKMMVKNNTKKGKEEQS
ncbi:MAG: LysO family transporter [Blautia sp.]